MGHIEFGTGAGGSEDLRGIQNEVNRAFPGSDSDSETSDLFGDTADTDSENTSAEHGGLIDLDTLGRG